MPTDLNTQCAYHVIKRQQTGGSLAITDVYNDEQTGKRLISIIEIEASDRDNEQIIELLNTELEKQFANAPTKSTEYAFENALAKANLKIKDILLEKPRNWLYKIHILILACDGEEIHLSSVGDMHAFLIQHDKISDVLADQHVTDAYGKRPVNPVKLFSAIVSGKLNAHNSVIITNESVLDYLSVDRIKKCAADAAPEQVVANLYELLQKTPRIKQFALAAVARRPMAETEPEITETAPAPRYIKQKKAAHLNTPAYEHAPLYQAPKKAYELSADTASISEEAETQPDIVEKYLRPESTSRMSSTTPHFSEHLKKLFDAAKPYMQTGAHMLLVGLTEVLGFVARGAKKSIPIVQKIPSQVYVFVKNKRARDFQISQATHVIKNKQQSARNRFLALPKKQQYAITAIIVLILVFTASIVSRAQNNSEQAAKEDAANAITELESRINEAQAALIYKNEADANTALARAHAILDTLAQNPLVEKNAYEPIAQTLNALELKRDKKILVTNPKKLATLSPAPITPSVTNIALLNNILYYTDGAQKKVTELINDGILLAVGFDDAAMESFFQAVPLTNNSLALLAQDAVIIASVNSESVIKEQFDFSPSDAKPFASYGGNLYTFDTNKQQITRYRKANKGFTPAQNWLTQQTDLSGSVDIAVDGGVYLLQNNGDILSFYQGEHDKTIVFPLAERTGDAARMYTAEGFKGFYIADPAHKRVVVLTRQGELVGQWITDAFASATDITVSDDEKTIYVLTGDALYSFEPTSQQ